jgi:hypothetical protein
LRILEKFALEKHPKETRHGVTYAARCPAHNDGRPSLSITVKHDGRVLLHCHAECPSEAILKRVGLALCDLMPPVVGRRTLEATYRYTDENCNLLFEVLRFRVLAKNQKMEKAFVQRRPDPAREGVWIYNVQGVRKVLYRLPAILASPAGQTVFIVEGEKDVDRADRIGLTATTNPGGAKKGTWLRDFNVHLVGKEVVIIPDNDEAGRNHVGRIYHSLRTDGVNAIVVELPDLDPKGDLTDWLNTGHSANELMELARKTRTHGVKPKWLCEALDVTQAPQASHAPQAHQVPQAKVDVGERELGPNPKWERIRYEGLCDVPLAEAYRRALAAQTRAWKKHSGQARDDHLPLFAFVRALRGNVHLQDLTTADAFAAVASVVENAGPPHSEAAWTKSFGRSRDEFATEFVDLWERVECPDGYRVLEHVVKRARADTLRFETDRASLAATYVIFLNVCARLQLRQQSRNIFLSTRQVGSALGVSHETISRWIKWARREGRLSRAREHVFNADPTGERRAAAEYRFNLRDLPSEWLTRMGP